MAAAMYLARIKSPRKTNRKRSKRYRAALKAKNNRRRRGLRG